MKTASFKTYNGPGRISIARWEPRGTPAGYRRYSALAPRRDMMRMPEDRYREIYFRDILGPLDAQTVWDEPSNWCHRTMVTEWFAAELGVVIGEHGSL